MVEEEATPSQPAIKEEEQMVEVLDSKENFEVFNQPQSLEIPAGDFSHLPPTQVSNLQETSSVPNAMVLQHKTKTSLLDLLEFHAGGNVPKTVIQTKPSTLPFTQIPQLDLADKKRKRDQKGKEAVEKGKGLPTREAKPQKGAKVARTA